MSTQRFDSSNNPVVIPDLVGSPNQQVADSAGTIINPAKEDGNLSSILTELGQKTEPTDTQPISAVSLPLPTGASTSTLQTTGNSSLSSIDTKTPSLGQTTMAASTPVVLASNQSAIPITDNAGSLTIDTPQLPSSLVGSRLDINNGAWLGSTAPTVGQKTMTASLPVAFASDQSALPISGSISVSSVPEEKTFIISALAIAIGTNKSMLSILNAGAGSKIMKLLGIYIRNAQTGAVTGIMADFRLYRMTGHSVGTDVTANIQLYDTTETLDSNITSRTGATIAGEFAQHIDRWFWSSDEFGPGAPDVESGDHPTQTLIKHHDRPPIPGKPLVIRPGEGITLKQITASTAGSFDIAFIFCHSA